MIEFKNILESSFDEQLEIRKWRNDEEVRKYMFNPQIISLESHISWLNSLKENKKTKVFYIIFNNKKIGINSLKKIGESNSYEWGIYLNNKVSKGQGIGKKIGKEFIKYVFETLKIESLEYEVLQKNERSLKLALSLGLVPYKKEVLEIEKELNEIVCLKLNRKEWRNMNRTFIIAEISANHGHSIEIAKKSIKVAKECGADAVKIQTYTADTITLNCDNDYFKIQQGTIWDGTTLYKLYQEAYTPWEWHRELFDYARKIGIEIFSTPFDKTAVDLLEELNAPIYKIASFEINDIPLIEYAASKGKPMIISTGVATEEEIKDAVEACRRMENNDITLLQCTSQYPAKLEDANLLMIKDLAERFKVKSGLSDHTMGNLVATTAVAMGAKVIEKHFIIDRNIGGPDSSFSMTPNEFKEMVDNIRNVEKMIGKVSYEVTEKKKNSFKFKRSLFISKDVKKGEVITEDNIKSVRPSDGISPKYYYKVLGKKVNKDLKFGTPLKFEDIEEEI